MWSGGSGWLGVPQRLPKLKHIFVAGEDVPKGALSVEEMLHKPLGGRYSREELELTKNKAEEFSLVLPTTGTTGFPKFVENQICAFVCRERACVENLKIPAADVIAALTPAAGGSNGRVYLAAPLAAAKAAMLEHFPHREALELIQRESVTIAPMVCEDWGIGTHIPQG
jgi:hypothetical protein